MVQQMDRNFPNKLSHEDEHCEMFRLIWKLGTQEQDIYTKYILPKQPRKFWFTETLELQKYIFKKKNKKTVTV